MSSAPSNTLTNTLARQQDAAVARFREWLAIPSVSTDPAYAEHVRAAAVWLTARLQTLGLEVTVHETGSADAPGHPVVLATAPPSLVANPDAPRVLFYGHYDVQPPDPLDLWTNPPFEPTLREGQLYARGASDDKAGVLSFIDAVEAHLTTTGKLPGPLTLLIEGEEEMGSPSLVPWMQAHADALMADVAVVSDTAMWDYPGDPDRAPEIALTTALRGLVYFEVTLTGPSRDLHSGVYGGTLANPANVLTRVLAKLTDDAGRIAIPGFYDDVADVPDAERDAWATLGFDAQAYADSVDGSLAGAQNADTLHRRWALPALDINGLTSGYQGAGAKTVLPSQASAKLSFRLPGDMDPHRVAEQFKAWLADQDLSGCQAECQEFGRAHPYRLPADSPHLAAAQRAVEQATGKPAVLVRDGATIPIGADLKTLLNLDTLFLGFGLAGDNIHAPDEHIALDRFHLGARVMAALLSALASEAVT